MGRHSKSSAPPPTAHLSKKKRNHDDFLEDNWDCPVCTFKNPRNLYKCKICDAPRGSSTRKSRITEQIIQKQQQNQFMLSFGEGTSSVLEASGSKNRSEKVRRESLAEHPDRGLNQSESEGQSESEDGSDSNSDGYSKQPGSSSAKLPVMMPASLRKKKAARGPKKRPEESDKSESESDESQNEPQAPKRSKSSKKSKTGRPMGRPRKTPKSETEDDEQSESDEPQEQPPSKKKKSLAESKSTEKGNGTAKKRQPAKAQIKHMFPKHRNIDKTTAIEYNITYGGSSVKFTEFKLRTNKPKPKSYPNDDNDEQQRTDSNQNEQNCETIEENGTKENGMDTTEPADTVKTEVPDNNPGPPDKENGLVESERNQDKAAGNQENSVGNQDKPDEIKETDPKKDPKEISEKEPLASGPSTSTTTVLPGFDNQEPKENFEAQFKNAFKNTNPKNQAKRGTETETQKEIKNNISQSLKKSLNLAPGEEQKVTNNEDLEKPKNQNVNSNNSDFSSNATAFQSRGNRPEQPHRPIPSNRPAPGPPPYNQAPGGPMGQIRPAPPYAGGHKPRPQHGRPLLDKGTAIGNPVKITRIGATSKENSIQRIGGPVTIRNKAPNVHRPKPTGPQHPTPTPGSSMGHRNQLGPHGGPPPRQMKNTVPNSGQSIPGSFKPRQAQPREPSPMGQQPPMQQGMSPITRDGPKNFRPTEPVSVQKGGPRGPLTPDKKIGRNPVGIPKPIQNDQNQGFRPTMPKPRPSYPRPINQNGQIAQPRPSHPGQAGSHGQRGQQPSQRHSPQSSPVLQRQHRREMPNQRPGVPPGVRPPNLSGRPPVVRPSAAPAGGQPRPYGSSGPPPRGHPTGPRQPGPRSVGPRGPMQRMTHGQNGPRPRLPINSGLRNPVPPNPNGAKNHANDGMRPIQGITVGRPVSIKTLKKTNDRKTNPSPTPGQQPSQQPNQVGNTPSGYTTESQKPPEQPLIEQNNEKTHNDKSSSNVSEHEKSESKSEKSPPGPPEKEPPVATPTVANPTPPITEKVAENVAENEDDDSDEEKSLQIDESGS